MESFLIVRNCEAVTIIGGKTNDPTEDLIVLIGKLLGSALRYLYDLLKGENKPKTDQSN